jgi:hypothetical protein
MDLLCVLYGKTVLKEKLITKVGGIYLLLSLIANDNAVMAHDF